MTTTGAPSRDRVATTYTFDIGGERSVEFVLDVVARQRRRLHGKPLSVLDIGCGTGQLTRLVAEAPGVAEVLGVDVDAASLEVAERALDGIPTARLERAGVEEIVPARRYDIVLLTQVLDHLEEAEAALRRVRTLMAPTGRLVVGISNGRGVYEASKRAFPQWPLRLGAPNGRTRRLQELPFTLNRESPHVAAYTLRSLRGLLRRSGLRVSRCRSLTLLLPAYPFCLAYYDLPEPVGDLLDRVDGLAANVLPKMLASNWYLECTRGTQYV